MIQRILSRQGAHVLVALLAVFSFGLIVRASAAVWLTYCCAGISSEFKLAPSTSSLEDLIPLVVGLGFITIGLSVWLASQRRSPPTFFLLISATLSAGLPTSWPSGDEFSTRLFYLLLAWLAPLTFQFHVALLDRRLRPVEKTLLIILYLFACTASFALLWTAGAESQQDSFSFWRVVIRIGLAISFVLAWMRLWREYRRRASQLTRGHIRLVLFGTLFGFAPLVFLSMLPNTFQLRLHVPYVVTFPGLLLAPLTYVYALYRSRWARAELALNRAAVYYLLVISLLCLYLVASAILSSLAADVMTDSISRNAVLTVALVLVFAPLKRGLEGLINWVLYGGEINYVGVVQRLAEALSLTLDRETFRRLILEEWAPAMRLARCLLLLRDEGDNLLLLGAAGVNGVGHLRMPATGALAGYLEAVDEPIPDDQLHHALKGKPLDTDEQSILSMEGIAFWLPLVSARNLQGLLLIGPKVGVDFFTPEDERILATVAYQAGVAAHNVRLTEELRLSKQELALAHQQLLIGREQERQRLAHELHDGAVQRLLGISYRMKEGPSDSAVGAMSALRREVLGVVTQLRSLIGELRPAGLAELGLAAALEGHIAALRRERQVGSLDVQLNLEQDEDMLPEPVAICLFRAAQEGLRNTLKHAKAQHFEIHLRFQREQVELEWCDDGCGFHVPARLSELANTGHYGLVSMSERVAAVGGQLTVHSGLNAGTQVMIRVPLKHTEEENGTQDSGLARG